MMLGVNQQKKGVVTFNTACKGISSLLSLNMEQSSYEF